MHPPACRRMVMIVGPPAAGKSTLMRAVTDQWTPWPRHDSNPAHVLYLDQRHEVRAAELGKRRDLYPGTDALSSAIIGRAIQWLPAAPAPLLLVEGARLTTNRWIDAAATHGYDLLLVLLDTDDQDELDRRCTARGSTQNHAWRRGVASRARNVHAYAATQPHCTTLTLDATQSAQTLGAQLLKEIAA